jgi:competence protein ComEC
MSNMILIPVFSILLCICLLVFMTYWSPVGSIVVTILGQWLELTHRTIQILADSCPVTYLPQTTSTEIVVYLFMMTTCCLVLPRRLKIGVLLLPVILTAVLKEPITKTESGELAITMLDVGQGECIHLLYPDGRSALVDTGGLPYPAGGDFIGERILSRYLWQSRLPALDYVLITHRDEDHKKGYRFLKKAFPISRLFFFELQGEYAEPQVRLAAGDSFSVAGVRHTLLHPPAEKEKHLNSNDSSIVFVLRYRGFSMLFTGDISRQVETEILPRLSRVTALKVAHHGSRSSTSQSILRVLQPKLALVSAGRRHNLAHPASEVLERLRSVNCPVLCTSRIGSIRLVTDGLSWKVECYSPEENEFLHRMGPESCPFDLPAAGCASSHRIEGVDSPTVKVQLAGRSPWQSPDPD